MGKRGRPTNSIIRQQMLEILSVLGEGYGYEIHKIHKHVFAPCTREVIYYHLRKGVSLGEIAITKVVKEEGNFSWGPAVEKTYYGVGKNAKPNPAPDVLAKIQSCIALLKAGHKPSTD